MNQKRSIFVIFIVISSVFISLLSLNQFTEAKSDDEDLKVTLNCRLESDSSEIHSNLMSTGTYSFWETPELDTGSFEHDNTRIDIERVQYFESNSSSKKNYSFNGTLGNQTINSTQINSYFLDAPLDTILTINMNYTSNRTMFSYLNNFKDLSALNNYDVEYIVDKFYVLNAQAGDKCVYVYDSDWNYLTKHDVSAYGTPYSITYDGSYFWIYFDPTADIRKFDSNFVYQSEYANKGLTSGIEYHNNSFYITKTSDKIRKYDSNWNYQQEYDLGDLGASCTPTDLEFYQGYWYIVDPDVSNSEIERRDANFNYVGKALNANPYGDAFIKFLTISNDSWWLFDTWRNEYCYEFFNFNTETRFENIYANFSYTIQGITYNDTIAVSVSDIWINPAYNYGNLTYYFDSSSFLHYNYTFDVTIPSQNITLIFETEEQREEFNFTLWIEYSTNEWRVPSEENLRINSEDITDETYNSGYASFGTFFNSLTIAADNTLYFELDTTTYFTFKFDLEAISKTYLKKSFRLLSDHRITIDEVELDSNLDVKKVYLNNIDLGKAWGYYGSIYNNTSGYNYTYNADQSMNLGNIFTLEVILSEELHLPLQFIMNSLSPGTSTIYLEGYSNQITYDSITRFNSIGVTLPTSYNARHYNATFDDIVQTPNYVSNSSENIYDSGYNINNLTSESVDFNRSYYQLEQNASYETNNTFSTYITDIPEQPSDFAFEEGSMGATGDLEDIDGSYTLFESEGDPQHYVGDSFKYDADGDHPTGWTITEVGADSSFHVEDVEDGHKKVIRAHDSSAADYSSMEKDMGASHETGYIEWWFRADNTNDAFLYRVLSPYPVLQIQMYFGLVAGKFQAYDGATLKDVMTGMQADRWYHFKIYFWCEPAPGHFNIYIDEVLKVSNYHMINYDHTTRYFQMLMDSTTMTHTDVWIDAFGYSWEAGYSVGDNFHNPTAQTNFTASFTLPEMVLLNADLYYSHKTNVSQAITVNIFNYFYNRWDLVNKSTNTAGFYNNLFTISSEHYDASNIVKVNFNNTDELAHFGIMIDELKMLFNYSINNPFIVNQLYINDTLLVVNQTNHLNWNCTFRFLTQIQVNQIYNGNSYLILNSSISNNTLESFLLANISAGFYELNITFIDNFSNFIIYSINYTIVSMISISLGYQNPVFVFSNNTINVNIFSENLISSVYYHNSSSFICQNSSVNVNEYDFDFKIKYDVACLYDISIKVISKFNDSFFVNISNLQFIKRAVYVDILNLYSRYWQDQNVSVEIVLKDSFNNNLSSQIINYTIEAPNSTVILNSSKTSNSSGRIIISLNLSIAFEQGFYHLNVSFSESSSYLNYWKLISFDVFPIERSVNCAQINLTINGAVVGSDNFIQVNNTSTISINSLDNATFDLTIVFMLNFSESQAYTTTFDYDLSFSASSDISQITITNATVMDYPSDFASYRFDNVISTSYVVQRSNFQISELIGDAFNNLDTFDISFRKYDNQVSRTQITTDASTTSNSVVFTETLLANRSFNYWYYKNVNSLTLNTLSLYHSRIGSTITTFTNEGLKYYFELDCNAGDRFTSTINVNPNWDVSFTINENDGIYSNITMRYKADLAVSGVSVALDFSNYSLYYENWSLGAQDSNTFKLTIPDIDFTSDYQYIDLIGIGGVPMADVTDIYSDVEGIRIIEGRKIDFWAYLNYTKFSQSYRINVSEDWNVYKLYYGDEKYTARSINDRIYEFNGTFDPAIDDSYFHFRTDPFESVFWEIDEKTDIITITIETSLDMVNCYFLKDFDPTQSHTLEVYSSDVELVDLTDRDPELEGKLYFGIDELDAGTTVIKIYIRYITALEILLQGVILFSIAGIVIAFYWKYSRDDKFRKNVQEKMKKIENKLKKDEKDYKEMKEIQFKEGKIYAK